MKLSSEEECCHSGQELVELECIACRSVDSAHGRDGALRILDVSLTIDLVSFRLPELVPLVKPLLAASSSLSASSRPICSAFISQ